MKVPLSWLKDFVEITLPLDELAYRLTMAGLEVEEMRFVGLPLPQSLQSIEARQVTKISGFAWDPETIVVGAILEVMPHPNADRLVLCRLDDGQQVHTVLTGAPNLFPWKGKGELQKPIKVAYAKEGAKIYDGHQPGQVLVTLKRVKIRGVDSYSMACSEKELGISDEHEGIIFLDNDAPPGMPLVDYMGDVVLDIAITPNIARNANIIGVAREIAALTDQRLHIPQSKLLMQGKPIQGRVAIQINDPQLNPRFVLGLVENITIIPSPYQVQRRLRLAGMRPINNIVDATNYAMLETGQPLHAFDYDVLVARADGKAPTIITRAAKRGEKLTTLDDVERTMNDFSVMVCDTAGALSIAGVMGGAESEVSEGTRNVLLEGAAWNMINIRRTVLAQNLPSEAAYRFSRGVHPAVAELGVKRCLELMLQWTGGEVAQGLVDNYPLPPKDPTVEITPQDIKRWLGIQLTAHEIGELLKKLEFIVQVQGERVVAKTPPHRLDINEGITGVADLMEEIARVFGYDRIPETRMADELPPQLGNRDLELEECVRDALVNLGLQEVVSYRFTSPERERRLTAVMKGEYVTLANPIASDRVVLRQSLLSSLMEVVERNVRLQERLAIFEIGNVFQPVKGEMLPNEPRRLAIALTGPRNPTGWQPADTAPMDFYDLKGIVSNLMESLQIGKSVSPSSKVVKEQTQKLTFEPHQTPSYHPGKCARLLFGEHEIGVMGELHPLLRSEFENPPTPLIAGEFDLEAILTLIPERFHVQAVPAYPPVLEDLALVVDEDLPAQQLEQVIRAAAGDMLSAMRLFDVYRGEKIGAGKKSLAYSLTYQVAQRTLTDDEVATVRQRIIEQVEERLGGKLRNW